MMRVKFFLLSLCGFALTLAANPVAWADEQDESIKKVVQRLNDVMLVAGKFDQQKKLQGLEYPLTSQGEFIFWKSHGLYLASDKPFFNASTITLDNIIHWQEDGSAVLSQEQNGLVQREISRTLLAFFSADLTLIEQRFHTQWQFHSDTWELTLTPRHEMVRKQMHSAHLRGGEFIQSLHLVAANGDVTDLAFSSITGQAAPTASQCRWFYLNNPEQHCAAATAQ